MSTQILNVLIMKCFIKRTEVITSRALINCASFTIQSFMKASQERINSWVSTLTPPRLDQPEFSVDLLYKLGNGPFNQQVNTQPNIKNALLNKFLKMNLKIIFITLATGVFAGHSYCSFETCGGCQKVISSGLYQMSTVAKTCRKIMRMPSCCEKYKRCEVLTECIPMFPSAFQSSY